MAPLLLLPPDGHVRPVGVFGSGYVRGVGAVIRLDQEKRARIAAAKAEIATIMDPLKAQERRERRARECEERKRVGKRVEGQRQPRERDPGFLAFLRRQPCSAAHLGGCGGPIEAAHIRYSDASRGARNPGMQAKAHDRHANPLCHDHHIHDQHDRHERDFWGSVGVNAYDNAARLFEAYRDGSTACAADASQIPGRPTND